MTSVARPRGPLPPRVYWVRRLALLLVLGLLVVGVQRLLTYESGAGSDDSAVSAATVGAPFELPTLAVPSGSAGMLIKSEPRKAALPKPEGPCDPGDLLVTPVIDAANAYGPVQVVLELTTRRSPACEFEVSGETVAVNVSTLTDARELLWTTQDCPLALTEATVVARREVPGRTVAQWDGRQSDDRCSSLAEWVPPGDYVVEAVALGGVETGEQEFEMGSPVRPTITRSVTPTPTPTSTRSPDASDEPTASTGAQRQPRTPDGTHTD